MSGLRNAAAPAAFVFMLALHAGRAGATEAPPPGVLVIHSNQRPTPAAILIEDTLRAVVPEGYGHPVQLYSEYLDSERSSLQAYSAKEAEFLRYKYGELNIRVIVAAAPTALQFVAEFRDRMLPGIPVVHIALPRDSWERMSLPPDIVGNTIDLDPAPTLRLAQRLEPHAKRIVVVLGAADRDRAWEQRVRTAAARIGDGTQVEVLQGLPTAEILRRVGALPRGTIVYTPGYFTDGAGEVITPRRSAELIAQASSVPVYGALDTFVGTGVVGTSATPYEKQTRDAGATIVRLLNGAAPAEIGTGSVGQVPVVDWRQLRRWELDERLLPSDSVVLFREPPSWEKYRLEITIGLAVLLFQAGLIAALLVERRSRRRTATALEESQRQMNLAANAARLSPWTWDTSRNKPPTTARRRARSEASKEQPVAFDDVVASVHPADRESVERAVGNALATGNSLDVEYRVVADNGGVRWIAARGSAAKDDSQRLLGVAVDITDRKTAELRAADDRTALRHMTRVSLMGQLSAAIAHQLNQPLSAILGNAEVAQKLLQREQLDRAELRAICDDIVSEDRRATEIIRRLSALYKRGDARFETIDLNELVRETLDLLRPELLTRHVVAVTDLAPELPPIEGSRVQLQQVVLNLALNATDAMNEASVEERRLVLRTDTYDNEVRLRVIDKGSGIAPERLATVFEPFWSTKEGGMGMGLAICQTIVAAHRGRIVASNNGEGGAAFCVSLPARQ